MPYAIIFRVHNEFPSWNEVCNIIPISAWITGVKYYLGADINGPSVFTYWVALVEHPTRDINSLSKLPTGEAKAQLLQKEEKWIRDFLDYAKYEYLVEIPGLKLKLRVYKAPDFSRISYKILR